MIRTIARATALVLLFTCVAAPAMGRVTFTLRGVSLATQSVSMTQRVGQNGQTVHEITVVFPYGTGLVILEPMAEYLRNHGVPPDPMTIKLTTASNGTITDERMYGGTIVKEISLSDLDGRSRDEMTMRMKFEASTLQTGVTGGLESKALATKYKAVIASNFSASIESLPSTRIFWINGHRMLPCPQGGCDSLSDIEFALRGADVATWRSWFSKASVEPAYSVNGSYTVMGLDRVTPIMKMRLIGMKPLSFTESVDEIGPLARVRFRVPSVRPSVN